MKFPAGSTVLASIVVTTMLATTGEVWGAESGLDRLVVVRATE